VEEEKKEKESSRNQGGQSAEGYAPSRDLTLTDKGFLFDPDTGLTYTLNQTASFIFSRLQQGREGPEIVEELVTEFEVESSRAEEDLKDFIQQLKDFGL
jgi:PqqD family protein of HPr-rel-A system